jgi:hypothetical protein
MNTLLFSAISLIFIGSAAAPVPSAVDTNVASKAEGESVEAHSDDVPASASEAAAARAAADDAEFERLMAAAPDQGDFGDSVITDKTGAEIRVSGFGFSDR